jgi:transcriptional regulator of nitric oxide reductase
MRRRRVAIVRAFVVGLRAARTAAAVAFLVGVLAARTAGATVFLAKDEALALAFPGAERIEDRVLILTDEQKSQVEKLARAPLESQLWTIYVGWKGGEVQGYAIIDTHVVRTLPETFMVVLDPAGTVRRVDILAFHEPPDYLPTERWVGQFKGRALDDDLKLNAGVQGITGATLSATAMTAGVRRALALFAILVKPGADGAK